MSLNLAHIAATSKFAAASFDDWCGTKPPGPPIPHKLEAALANGLLERLGLNPQPLPPRAEVAVSDRISGGASVGLDDWCGTPWPKHFPPPPPPLGGVLGNLLGGLQRF